MFLRTADGSGKACRWPVVLEPLIRDVAWSKEALRGTVDVFWVHLITQVSFLFLQRVAREPSNLSRGKVPALPALPTAGPPLEQQQSAHVEMAFSGRTRTPQTAPAPVSPALGVWGQRGSVPGVGGTVIQAWGHTIPDPCVPPTGVPSAPRSVISNVNETSLVLEWSEPQDTGGRDDLLYNVICKKCSVERRLCTRCDDNVEFVPRQLGLTERRIYISNLMAHTQYTFEIQAVNGISNKSPYPPHFASVNITTNQAGQWS